MLNCRHFSGYKPCGFSENCDKSCKQFSETGSRIFLVHLGALGAVLRSTALLPAIHRKYPNAHITWITAPSAKALLQNNPLIDKVLTTDSNDLLKLRALEFDVALVVDKSIEAAGIVALTKVKESFGFRVDAKTGAILPANPEAQELWEIGLSDHTKFFVNKKSEIQLITEALALPYLRDDYILKLTDTEMLESERRRIHWKNNGHILVGINTGCSPHIPYKKLSIEGHRKFISMLLKRSDVRIVLLGGNEDRERNQQIGHGLPVLLSPTDRGLRDGMVSVDACDIVVSGDSLGMHMAIALKKWVTAWFGPTCAHEIDLFERGEAIITKAPCSPCWSRSCNKSPMCYDLVEFSELVDSTLRGIDWLKSSYRLPSLGMSSSESHFLEL